ncbi:Protein BZZ1 [Oopsacas minuta]|uniref:Protein BZZ1 n=1 Tax=Oopsacas minuta TaxID=111878 RepID=A0AAV7JZI9_9METZ|nr:Protein BZZ1 [Oopsacas minuta]
MTTTPEDGEIYAKIDEVITDEGSDTAPPLPKLPKCMSLSGSYSNSLSGHSGRVRSESMFSRSTKFNRPISILEDEVGMQNLRDIPHLIDNTRGHASLAIKFAESVSDFFKKLSELNENYSRSLHGLVKQYISKNNDLKRERYFCAGSLFSYWESMVGEVEQQSLAYQEFSQTLRERISLPLRAIASQKKELLKKTFQAREEFAFDLNRQKEENQKLYKEYAENHTKVNSPNVKPALKESLTLQCHNSHNDYVLQLGASNAFSYSYHKTHLISLLDCVEELLHTLSNEFKSSLNYYISQSNHMLKKIVGRFDTLSDVLCNVSFSRDISHFVKLQNSSKIPEPIRFVFQDPDMNLNPGESVMTDNLIISRQTQQALTHRSSEVRQKKLSLNRQISNLTKEYNSIRDLYKQYDQSPEYGNKADIEGAMLTKKIEVMFSECNLETLDGKASLFEALDSPQSNSKTASLPISNQTEPIERLHLLISFNYKKFKKCDYCNEQLSVIKSEMKCEICYMRLHRKCQNNISYCNGIPIRDKEPSQKKRDSNANTPNKSKESQIGNISFI